MLLIKPGKNLKDVIITKEQQTPHIKVDSFKKMLLKESSPSQAKSVNTDQSQKAMQLSLLSQKAPKAKVGDVSYVDLIQSIRQVQDIGSSFD